MKTASNFALKIAENENPLFNISPSVRRQFSDTILRQSSKKSPLTASDPLHNVVAHCLTSDPVPPQGSIVIKRGPN